MKTGQFLGIAVIAALVWWLSKGQAKTALATGQEYIPYPTPRDLGGGYYEWGYTKEGTVIVATRDPSTYAAREWGVLGE